MKLALYIYVITIITDKIWIIIDNYEEFDSMKNIIGYTFTEEIIIASTIKQFLISRAYCRPYINFLL